MKCTYILLSILTIKVMAETNPPLEQLKVQPFGSARSKILEAGPQDRISIRADQEGELVPAIFIYEKTLGPVAKNNEVGDDASFQFTVAEQGSYQVVIYSKGDAEVTYTVQRLAPEPTRSENSPGKATAQIVPVYFATNRVKASLIPPKFIPEPSEDGTLSYGVFRVRIPLDHRMGHLEYPAVLWYEFGVNPEKLLIPEVTRDSRFFEDVRSGSLRSDKEDALVFIHGFNTTMEDAARRTAQLAYDLKFKGPAILFSWPSHNAISDYNKDSRNAELSASPLRDLLVSLSQRSGIKRIHVIAHSMGNRVLAQALTRMGETKSTIREIALMAPDIDAAIFKDLATRFPKSVGPIALYASSRDHALLASAGFGGYRRAGQGGKDICVVPGIDTIDASSVDTSLIGIGHQYFADRREILGDLYSFFLGQPPQSRFAIRPSSNGAYWVFAP